MKKGIVILIVVIVFIFITIFYFVKIYNNMIAQDEAVNSQWANVENVYQRRNDLIPNLVNTVKGYADFEKSTLTQVIEARSKATSITIDPKNLNEESIRQFQKAQNDVSSALSRLLLVMERYPDLKANQNFLELQAQLEGTENRIAVERRNFNETAKAYNVYIRRFPKNVVAGLFGFVSKAYFKSDEGAEKAPKVQF